MKVHRLLSIVMLLLTNKRIGAQELAERFEVSLRTLYRDLETINAAGIPVVSFSGPNGGYEIMEQYHIDRQIVTLEDLRSIMTALNGLEASLKDPQLHDVIAKVGVLITKAEQAKLEESGDELLFNANLWRGREADSGTISALRRAARFRHVVRFRYVTARGDEEEREAEPVGLAWKGYAWYLHAWCRLRRDFRTFRLTRIRDCRVFEERFAPRGVSLKELDARFDALTPGLHRSGWCCGFIRGSGCGWRNIFRRRRSGWKKTVITGSKPCMRRMNGCTGRCSGSGRRSPCLNPAGSRTT